MRTKLRLAKVFAVSVLFFGPMPVATRPATVNVRAMLVSAKTAKQTRLSGLASWYGEERQGDTMANGQTFDRFKLTAASWSLPLGTKIRVVNAENGKSVVVTVTDRGPAQNLHRILDLSEAAAERLGYTDRGLAFVYYTLI